MTSEVRRVFLEATQPRLDRHNEEITDLVDILGKLQDKHSQLWKDAMMLLRYHREMADISKRMIEQYG